MSAPVEHRIHLTMYEVDGTIESVAVESCGCFKDYDVLQILTGVTEQMRARLAELS